MVLIRMQKIQASSDRHNQLLYCNILLPLCPIINCSIGPENHTGIAHFKTLVISNMMVHIKLTYSSCYFYLHNSCLFVFVTGISNEYIADENLIHFPVNKMLTMNDKRTSNSTNTKIPNFYQNKLKLFFFHFRN